MRKGLDAQGLDKQGLDKQGLDKQVLKANSENRYPQSAIAGYCHPTS
jgi:hypothetical protein